MSVESSELLKQENHDRIIRAAQELLATKPVRDTTLNEIAAKAGITKRTITNIFGTKNNLILQATIGSFQEFKAKYYEIIETDEFKSKSGLEQIMYLEVMRCKGLYNNPYTARMVNDVVEMCLNEEYERESFREYLCVANSMVEFFREPLQKGYRDGSISRKMDRDDAEAFLYFSFGVTIQRMSILNANPNTRDAMDLKKIMRHILASTRHYLEG